MKADHFFPTFQEIIPLRIIEQLANREFGHCEMRGIVIDDVNKGGAFDDFAHAHHVRHVVIVPDLM